MGATAAEDPEATDSANLLSRTTRPGPPSAEADPEANGAPPEEDGPPSRRTSAEANPPALDRSASMARSN
eukprot:11216619-Lingulodinium_polyedra.AAC.1